jgi:hypothetical protein
MLNIVLLPSSPRLLTFLLLFEFPSVARVLPLLIFFLVVLAFLLLLAFLLVPAFL